jgi:release factor glutamine methyltransferase
MPTIRQAIATATTLLTPVSDTPWLDAELLMAHALDVEREVLLLDPSRFAVPDGFAALLTRRLAHEPIAYILGYRDFWSIRLSVGPGVLVPRADSETLIEAAVDLFGTRGPATILDLGTGPGTLLLAALHQWPHATGAGIERSTVARDMAIANAAALGLSDRAAIVAGDWTQPDSLLALGRFDCILVNPPYIESCASLDKQVALHEPAEALFAGPDGLDDYRIIFPLLLSLLAPGGAAIIEIGSTQCDAVMAIAVATGLTVECRQDLGGRNRVLICRPPPAPPDVFA